MRLSPFNVNEEYKRIGKRNRNLPFFVISGISLLLLSILIYQTYAIYIIKDRHNITNANVGTFSTGDIKILGIYVDEVTQSTFPVKGSGKAFEKLVCDNSGTGSWDSDNWSLTINNIGGKTNCNVYFITFNPKWVKSDITNVVAGTFNVDIDANMIPITWNENNSEFKWYDYLNKMWANAVTVKSNKLSYYQSSPAGTEIEEADIMGYFVYIPRYKYKLQTVTFADSSTVSPSAFDIVFETAPTAKSNGTIVGNYLTHPAFTFGTTELNGIWVGKFETSYNSNVTSTTTSATALANGVYIKPNIYSLRHMTIADMYTTATSLKTSNYHNVPSSDTHMMKNSEWGAVVYLSHSNYGSCTAGVCKEVQINSAHTSITGCGPQSSGSKTSGGTCNAYTTVLGQLASTTQNLYGIYDMSGGNYEYVMGNYNNVDSLSNLTMSSIPTKHKDIYTMSSSTNCTLAQCAGHALYETAGWYSATNYFVESEDYTFFDRGGCYNNIVTNPSIFNMNSSDGRAMDSYSFRISVSKT